MAKRTESPTGDVYVLQDERMWDNGDETELVYGVYPSKDAAIGAWKGMSADERGHGGVAWVFYVYKYVFNAPPNGLPKRWEIEGSRHEDDEW